MVLCRGLIAASGSELTGISLFSKSLDCAQEVAPRQLAHLGPVRIPGGKGVFQADSLAVRTHPSFRLRYPAIFPGVCFAPDSAAR